MGCRDAARRCAAVNLQITETTGCHVVPETRRRARAAAPPSATRPSSGRWPTPPRQHGRRRVQARRPRPDLPQVHLRRLRGAARQARRRAGRRAPTRKTRTSTAPSTSSGCRRRRAGTHLKAQAKQPTIGQLVDDAMAGHRARQPALKGVLPKDYARPALDKHRLGELIDLISNIQVGDAGGARPRTCSAASTSTSSPSSRAPRARRAASSTPRAASSSSWSRCSSPTSGRVYDPCCGSAGMFVQSVEFIARTQRQWERRQGAGRHLDLRPGVEPHDLAAGEDEPRHPRHRRRRSRTATPSTTTATRPQGRLLLANPPFNICDWGGERLRDDKRWQYGVPPAGTPTSPGCSTSSTTWRRPASRASCSRTARCRRTSPARARSARTSSRPTSWTAWSRCPGQLFYSTQIPACLWFLARDRQNGKFRDRAARCSSSTRASWAAWWTGPTAS